MLSNVLFSCDHAGLPLIEPLNAIVHEMGFDFTNLGAFDASPVDYPDQAVKLVHALQKGQYGVLICGSGIGMSITANRFEGIRAALCTSEYEARVARAHNDANVLCLGARVIGVDQAKACLSVFLTTPFSGGRHACRVEKMDAVHKP